MPATSRLNSGASGCSSLSIELLASSTPISRMASDTTKPAMYSMRPWPKGWSGSGFFPARRKPASVMMDEPASDRLLKASAVMAMEPDKSPANSLPQKSRTLRKMPSRLHSVPYFSRTAGEAVSSLFGIRRLTR